MTRLDRLIRQTLSNGKVSAPEVEAMIKEVSANRHVSVAERVALKQALSSFATQFDPAARRKLETFLGAPRPEQPRPPQNDPYTVMTAALTTAASGGLTGAELARAEQSIAARYGPQVAKQSLLKALEVRADDLTLDGVTWLQQGHGKMEAHVERLQTVLQSHLAGARLLDANFDGRLDERDKAVLTRPDGTLEVRVLGPELRDRVKIGAAVVGACEDMAKAGHGFALWQDHKFNPQLWEPIGGGGFIIKLGVTPSEAMKDLFAHPELYEFECLTAQIILRYQAMLSLLGPADFDAACVDLRVGPARFEPTLGAQFEITGAGVPATDARKAELRVGDYTYFKNWDVTPQAHAEGWQGENVVVLGEGRYYGHPFGITTGDEIVRFLDEKRNPGSTRSASLIEVQGHFRSEVLALDVTPDDGTPP